MKKHAIWITSVLVLAAGCHTARVGTAGGGPRYSDRQVFSAGGLVRLSEPAGEECGSRGLQYVESEQSVTDYLLSLGIGLAGAGAAAAICGAGADLSDEDFALCVGAGGSLAPWLVSTRTVEYECQAAPEPTQVEGVSRLRSGAGEPIRAADSNAQLVQGLTPSLPRQ